MTRIETDVYYTHKDSKGIIHQGKDNIDGTTHLRPGGRVKIEYLKSHPDSSKIHHNRPWWYGVLFTVLGGTILFESLWHHGAYGIREHINPKILAGCLRNRRSELTNSTIKNIVNSVIYRTKESSHDHYSQ